ncbi:response regulator transcription factor [Variovorax sp. J22P240]|uniref:response regulator transcription factor n=1 Tax=Variovorax sp. J22P240 TaxID=3053514 RepID=UPI0025749DD4|nr:response regulator transcription factor [Variovorax sp. J22P240]MDM0001984.1 response regulator transcription factor [Variovorax sp. J22P240]
MHSVVIVDDHPAIRLAVRAALESSGRFEVVGEADSGPAALEMIREHVPALVILDLDLPQMSGLELVDRLKASGLGTKLLVLSGQQEAIFATRAMQSGANGFLSKSADMHKLVEAAQSVIAGYSVFPSSALVSLTGPTSMGADAMIKSLSDRELAVLQDLARGMSNKEIADKLLISNKTVSTYKVRIFEKLGISTLVELVDFARTQGLVS